MLIYNVVGARPNFMKMAPVVKEMNKRSMRQMLVHTGQHYDKKMSRVFFEELEMPHPDFYLGVGSGTHACQTARIMMEFEAICQEKCPDLIVVAGDVNSTLAVALVASKLHIPVAHIESGLRSFDRSMPEEINRIVTDNISDLLFTSEDSANENLIKEGIEKEKIHFVGNCMIDSLYHYSQKAAQLTPWTSLNIEPHNYAMLTLHRPSNVDESDSLNKILQIICEISEHVPLVFPVHPRTRSKIESMDVRLNNNIKLCEPLSYLQFTGLMARAAFVLTDSGGIQEETTALGIPCLTMRSNTERPATVIKGTNRLVGNDREKTLVFAEEILRGDYKKRGMPELWDGKASQRVVDIIESMFCKQHLLQRVKKEIKV